MDASLPVPLPESSAGKPMALRDDNVIRTSQASLSPLVASLKDENRLAAASEASHEGVSAVRSAAVLLPRVASNPSSWTSYEASNFGSQKTKGALDEESYVSAPMFRTLSEALLHAHNNNPSEDDVNGHSSPFHVMPLSAVLSGDEVDGCCEHLETHACTQSAGSKTPGTLRVISSSSGHPEVSSDAPSLMPISVGKILYEHSSTGTDLSTISSPHPSNPPPPISEALSLCNPMPLPLPEIRSSSPKMTGPGSTTQQEDTKAHEARIQLRTLLRLRQRTLKRLRALRNSIPEDSAIESFDINAFHEAPVPHMASRTASVPPLATIQAVRDCNKDTPRDFVSAPHNMPTAHAWHAQAQHGHAKIMPHTSQHTAAAPQAASYGGAQQAQSAALLSTTPTTRQMPSNNPTASAARTAVQHNDAFVAPLHPVVPAAYNEPPSSLTALPPVPSQSAQRTQQLVQRVLGDSSQHAAAQEAAACAVRAAVERAAQREKVARMHAELEELRSTSPTTSSSSIKSSHSTFSEDSSESALKENVPFGRDSALGGDILVEDESEAAVTQLIGTHVGAETSGSCTSSSLGTACMQSLSEYSPSHMSMDSPVTSAEDACMHQTALLSMQDMHPTMPPVSHIMHQSHACNAFPSMPQDVFVSPADTGCVFPLMYGNNDTALQPGLPESSPTFPEEDSVSSSPTDVMRMQSSTPTDTEEYGDRFPSSNVFPLATNLLQHDQGSARLSAASLVSGLQSLKSHSAILAPSVASDIAVSLPEASEEDSAFCRFMQVLGERRNSVDLPPGVPDEEWSRAMPGTSSCGGLSSLVSPASKWGSQSLLEASPKVLAFT